MLIQYEMQGDVCILRLRGRFVTGSDADYLRAKKNLEETGYRKVLLDCSQIPYVDSTGLTFLVGLYRSVTNAGGQLALVGVTPRVREVLALTWLDRIFHSFEDEREAIAALAESETVETMTV